MKKYEYKVAIYSGNPSDSPQFPGNTKVDPVEFTEFLNQEGNDGWEIISIERKNRGVPSFFQHEDFVVVMKRIKNENLGHHSKNKNK